MVTRAVVYARVCVDGGQNLEAQLQTCREYARQQGRHVVEEIVTQGPGRHPLAQPEMQALMEMARSGKFDVLIARDAHVLSRDLSQLCAIEEQLRQRNVQIEFVIPGSRGTPATPTIADEMPGIGSPVASGRTSRQGAEALIHDMALHTPIPRRRAARSRRPGTKSSTGNDREVRQ